jgi:hypothetical protein
MVLEIGDDNLLWGFERELSKRCFQAGLHRYDAQRKGRRSDQLQQDLLDSNNMLCHLSVSSPPALHHFVGQRWSPTLGRAEGSCGTHLCRRRLWSW